MLLCLALLVSVEAIDLRYLRREIAPTTTQNSTAVNCTEPTWGAWFEELGCNHNCGACGVRVLRRHCLTSACPCLRQLACKIGVCEHPRPACCPPFKIIYYKGFFGCGPQDEEIVQEFMNLSFVPSSTPWNPFAVRFVATTRNQDPTTEELPTPGPEMPIPFE